MYGAKQRASPPVSIVSPATLQVGSEIEEGSFACFASAAMADGVMSGEPTMYSCFRRVVDSASAIEAHHDRDDAERDQNGCGDHSA